MNQAVAGSKPSRVSHGHNHVNTLAEHHLCWRNNDTTGLLDPVWPREPDIQVARKLALEHLPADLFSDASISPFAQGAFHRLYCLSSDHTTAEYLMRVALPVDPFFKTESEVATMDYIRRNSSIPVPEIVAYASSASNELGFEWILMERVRGVPLEQVWDTMPFQAKMHLTVELARSLKKLRQRPFPMLGSIYYADVWNQVDYMPTLGLDAGIDGTFVVGRMVSTRFFRDKRLLLRPNRGPFTTARELATSEAALLARRIQHLSPSPGTEYYCEADEMLADDGAEVLETVDKLVEVVPRIYSATDDPEDIKVLWHDDISLMNVLVNPETHKLVGIVDWESVSIAPALETEDGVPHFLQGVPVQEPPPVGSLPPEEEKAMVEIRKDWDLVLLRRKYAEIVGPMYSLSLGADARIDLKRGLSRSLANFEDRWTSARYWLKQQFGASA
ncbi:uncharacterized protein NECHADRAFT_56498 [Fusarium vanettenii 77-13-4]|uniref:Altered inheritance of mitochondria protein 9, mitochondrial n=1 Tax=Fusarium vanettenii (strain ATCC MYA-4622 / CBS 123669 / FGSC 9596 / NRRL 45880 / 77-13-4) TaxID=660122 RepID=C7ZR03_FUSV7|nr:uncharacterized protein NECHADRAFT_56498 [Fusarium vanettenii 77-13-4]EEU33558.1 hypothetical protein NECHADRAFT_56498 [Fusarium vanettenii 77-13-4]